VKECPAARVTRVGLILLFLASEAFGFAGSGTAEVRSPELLSHHDNCRANGTKLSAEKRSGTFLVLWINGLLGGEIQNGRQTSVAPVTCCDAWNQCGNAWKR
jgi:hypothetical protein